MATTAADITPLDEGWEDDSTFGHWASPALASGSIAFQVLVHSQEHGPDMVRVARSKLPAGLESEDLFEFLYILIGDAAKIGFMVRQIHGTFDEDLEEGRIARAVAQLLSIDIVETDQAFDPQWRAKRAGGVRDVA